MPNDPFIIGFYNVYRATDNSASAKVEQIVSFVESDPTMDAFCLCETDGSLNFAGYEQVGIVNTLDKNFEKSQLGLVLYVREGHGFKTAAARELGVRGQSRMVIKLSLKQDDLSELLDVYFCHANASYTGGLEAVEWANGICSSMGDHVCIGDFNVNLLKTTGFIAELSHGVSVNCMSNQAGNPIGTHIKKKQGAYGAYTYQALDFAVTSEGVDVEWVNTDWEAFGKIDHKPLKAKVTYG